MNPFQSIYDAMGEGQICELVGYFYQEVKKNPPLRKLYPEDLEPAERRFFLFLIQAFGESQISSDERGHPRRRMRHLDWKIDPTIRSHWLNATLTALDKLNPEQNVRKLMMKYFIKVANHRINHE